MNMFNNLSSLQRRFIRNCFIALGVIAWIVFGIISAFITYWDIGCLIFSLPFVCFGVFIVIMGIYEAVIRFRFKWKAMGILSEWAYIDLKNSLYVYNWDWDRVKRFSSLPDFALEAVEPFYPKYYVKRDTVSRLKNS